MLQTPMHYLLRKWQVMKALLKNKQLLKIKYTPASCLQTTTTKFSLR